VPWTSTKLADNRHHMGATMTAVSEDSMSSWAVSLASSLTEEAVSIEGVASRLSLHAAVKVESAMHNPTENLGLIDTSVSVPARP
jgi:hypothetical protein